MREKSQLKPAAIALRPMVADISKVPIYYADTVTNHTTKRFRQRGASIFLSFMVLMPVTGCDSAPPARTDQPLAVAANQDGKIDLPGPKPDPNRDEATELIKACGAPASDVQKSVEGGTQLILSYPRYGVDVFFLQNTTDSPMYAASAVFSGENNIDRKTLSRKMPCSKKVSLYSVDVYDPYLRSH